MCRFLFARPRVSVALGRVFVLLVSTPCLSLGAVAPRRSAISAACPACPACHTCKHREDRWGLLYSYCTYWTQLILELLFDVFRTLFWWFRKIGAVQTSRGSSAIRFKDKAYLDMLTCWLVLIGWSINKLIDMILVCQCQLRRVARRAQWVLRETRAHNSSRLSKRNSTDWDSQRLAETRRVRDLESCVEAQLSEGQYMSFFEVFSRFLCWFQRSENHASSHRFAASPAQCLEWRVG